MVVDWDVHHGNGIQSIFYEDPRVLYVSLHRHEHAPGLVYGEDGAADKCGAGAGAGFNLNVPFPYTPDGFSDADYEQAMCEVVLPVARQFSPQLVIVAAGFDGCAGDPIGGFRLSPAWFGRATKQLQSIGPSEGKMLLVLEGGYNPAQVSRCAAECVRQLLTNPHDDKEEKSPSLLGEVKPETLSLVAQVRQMQRQYWSCLL